MSAPRTDSPRPPPFLVGTRLRYRGARQLWHISQRGGVEDKIVLLGPGIEVVITEVRQGRRGTGKLLDEDDEIYDVTRDGHSVYYVRPFNPQTLTGNHGRCIHAEDAAEWEVIDG